MGHAFFPTVHLCPLPSLIGRLLVPQVCPGTMTPPAAGPLHRLFCVVTNLDRNIYNGLGSTLPSSSSAYLLVGLVQYYLFRKAFPDSLLCLTIPCTSPDNDHSSKFCVSLKIHLMFLFLTEQAEERNLGCRPQHYACALLRQK